MKTTIHCDERITNIRHTIYVKLFWGIIIANELTYLLDYFFKTSLIAHFLSFLQNNYIPFHLVLSLY